MALQALYLTDSCHLSAEIALKTTIYQKTSDLACEFCKHLVMGVLEHKDHIDSILSRYTQNWEIHRMASVDRNILRLSAFEILNDLDTPVSVIIDEAIEIAKTYSTEESGKFVNGVLDKVKNERRGSSAPA